MRPTQEHEKQEPGKEQKQNKSSQQKCDHTNQQGFRKTLEGAAAGKNKNPYGTPRRTTLFFLLTRFIDGLQRRRASSIQAG
jgi:hypothetical protein